MEDSAPAETDPAADDTEVAEPGPVPLDDIDALTAADYLDVIDAERRPIDESPCAESPLLDELGDFDQFIPVVFDGELASLLVQSDDPTSAVIVGPTCEVELG